MRNIKAQFQLGLRFILVLIIIVIVMFALYKLAGQQIDVTKSLSEIFAGPKSTELMRFVARL